MAGTSLDEVDLEFYLSHRTPTASREDRGPSILVEKTDDAITQDMCKRHNLLHFVGFSHDFFSYCAAVLPSRPTPYELIPLETRKFIPAGVSNIASLAFQSDFEMVPATAKNDAEPSRFLYGHPPTWPDLASNLDVSRPIVGRVISEVENLLVDTGKDTRLVLICETAGAGKTTILKRAAFELAGRGLRVLMCTSLGRPSKSTASVIDLVDEPIVLVFDNFADQVSSVVDLLATIEKKDVVFLAAERSYRLKYLETMLSGNNFRLWDQLPLQQNDVARLIDQYVKYGLIGDHTTLKDRNLFGRKIVSDPIAIACCRIMNDFSPLDQIVSELLKVSTSEDLDRYLIAAIARLTFTGGVRYEILSSVMNNAGLKGQLEASHPLPLAFFDRAKTFLVPENSTLGDRVLASIRDIDQMRVLRCFVALANGIAPRVNRAMIIKRSPESRMTGRLFDYDDVISKFLGDKADSFYAQTQESWRWNSRYWEQVALLNLTHFYEAQDEEARGQYLLAAVQHARHAVSIELHPFPLTTLGKTLMAQVFAGKEPRLEIFEEALERLNKAIELEVRWHRSAPQPYFSLFNGVVKYLDSGEALSSNQADTIKQHMESASRRFPRDSEVHNLLGELGRKMT